MSEVEALYRDVDGRLLRSCPKGVSMMPGPMRAVLVESAEPARIITAEPAFLWTILGCVPHHFASFALSHYGQRFGAVWACAVAVGEPNRFVFSPMFRYRQFLGGDIRGPIVITAAKNDDQALSLTAEEAASSIAFAARWPTIAAEPSG